MTISDRKFYVPPITPAERGERIPLSFAQQRLWFLAQLNGGSEAYHMPLCLRVEGMLDGNALRRALERIVVRHDVLRTTFAVLDGEPVQQITPAEEGRFELTEHDLRRRHDAEEELGRLIAEEVREPFDLAHGPLIRGRLIRLSEEDHTLLITMHHIVSDGWSMGILRNELSKLYEAFRRHEEDPLPRLKIQYADYTVWQRRWIEGDVLRDQAEYWKKALAGVPEVLELPADRPRPAQQDYSGSFVGLKLNEQLTTGLKALSYRHGVTLHMTLLTAWAALLSRLSGQDDIVVGTPVANRRHARIENLIGFFVNTLVLRLDLSGSPTVTTLLRRVGKQSLAAQQHQDIPFEYVVELLQPSRCLAYSPLFQVMFAFQNINRSQLKADGMVMRPINRPFRTSKFDLSLYLHEDGGVIAGGVEYATALFEPATIERYLGYFRNLLEAMVADDTQQVDRLPMLPESERRQLLYEWNDTWTEYPGDKCVHELFEAQVEKTPEATAVVFEETSLSYGELNRRANRLAHYLRERGIQPDDRVAICVERSLEMVVALLGVLKAGGAYVPLDPAYPAERLRFMIEDSAPIALLTQSHLADLFKELNRDLPLLDLAAETPAWHGLPETNLDPQAVRLTPRHLAYVIYTSGSTGQPKGVMVEHRSVVNILASMQREPGIASTDRLLAVTTLSFDIAALELYLPLSIGARVVIADRGVSKDGAHLLHKMRQGVTMMQATPMSWKMLIESGWEGEFDCKVFCGGEALHSDLAQELASRSSSVWNLYGPTETTIWSLMKRVNKGERLVSIGRPIANTRIYILDAHRQPAPVGVSGELYIAGAGVARGYLNRPELTAERFLADPFADEPGARMYRTGDLGRWLSDGNIEFLGRNDFQVKIRGFRIELEEIEARLTEHPAVRDAVVVAREDAPGDKRLVAYYTSNGEGFPAAEQLRAHLSALLPEYMVPAAYVHLEALPLTANGKLDRRALPAPEADAYAVRGYEAPQGEIEEKLARIWAELLKVDRVARHDNFFELGGHSLLAVRVTTRLREDLKLEATVADLFAHPLVADFAYHLENASRASLPPITPAGRTWEASPAQFRTN